MRLTGLVSKRTFGNPNINEASEEQIKKAVDKISELTSDNNHTEAIIELAKFLGNKKYVTILNSINTIHDVAGHMPPQLELYRKEIHMDMMKQIQSKYGKSAFQAFTSAF